MKKLFTTSVLILTFCFASFAQTNQIEQCPTISITRSVVIPNPNELVIFTAEIGEGADKLDLLFDWKVSNKEAIEGQGTKQIKVLWNDFCENDLTATVEVKGLPKNCQNTYSETAWVCCLPASIQIDEFSTAVNRVEKVKLGNLAKEAQNNPTAQVYIIEKFENHTSLKLIELKSQKTIDYLIAQGIERNTITLLNALVSESLTEFWLVPPGASPPDCDDCLEFKK